MSAARNIPTIDLGDYLTGDAGSGRRFVQTLGEGLVEFGFLNVEGHGIDPDLIRGTYELWQRFFDLPEEVKRKYAGAGDGSRGYTPFGVEHAKDNPLPDLKEFWHVGQEPPEGHPLRREYPGNVWPEEIPEIRQPTRRLYESLERVAENVLRALAEVPGRGHALPLHQPGRARHDPPGGEPAVGRQPRAVLHAVLRPSVPVLRSHGDGPLRVRGQPAEVPADHGRRVPGPAAAGDRAQEVALRAQKR